MILQTASKVDMKGTPLGSRNICAQLWHHRQPYDSKSKSYAYDKTKGDKNGATPKNRGRSLFLCGWRRKNRKGANGAMRALGGLVRSVSNIAHHRCAHRLKSRCRTAMAGVAKSPHRPVGSCRLAGPPGTSNRCTTIIAPSLFLLYTDKYEISFNFETVSEAHHEQTGHE